jgi:hypothetical protein
METQVVAISKLPLLGNFPPPPRLHFRPSLSPHSAPPPPFVSPLPTLPRVVGTPAVAVLGVAFHSPSPGLPKGCLPTLQSVNPALLLATLEQVISAL